MKNTPIRPGSAHLRRPSPQAYHPPFLQFHASIRTSPTTSSPLIRRQHSAPKPEAHHQTARFPHPVPRLAPSLSLHTPTLFLTCHTPKVPPSALQTRHQPQRPRAHLAAPGPPAVPPQNSVARPARASGNAAPRRSLPAGARHTAPPAYSQSGCCIRQKYVSAAWARPAIPSGPATLAHGYCPPASSSATQ